MAGKYRAEKRHRKKTLWNPGIESDRLVCLSCDLGIQRKSRRSYGGNRTMGADPTPVQANPANDKITEITNGLSLWCRYVNGVILATVWGLFVGKEHLPKNTGTLSDWHHVLWMAGGAILALILDRGQAINDLLAFKRKRESIEKGHVNRIIFGKHEFQFKLSWSLFYAKLALTLLNAAGCLLILGRVISRWTP